MGHHDSILFIDNIKKHLNGLSKEQQIYFSWICCIRVLPFLSIDKDFVFWGEQKQPRLYSIFYAIDHVASYPKTPLTLKSSLTDVNEAASSSFAASKAAAATVTYACAATISSNFEDYICKAVNAFIEATSFNEKLKLFWENVETNNQVDNFTKIILSDIEHISKNDLHLFNNDTFIYGSVWNDFLDTLNELDCAYWANWYEKVFDKGFILDADDFKAIEIRLNIPEEIREQGAAEVAKYLEIAHKQGVVSIQRETRLIVLGSAGAGKTTLVRRLNGDFNEIKPDESTHGVNTSISLDCHGIKTRVWDFGGQVIYHASHRCFITKNCVYILVVNARTEENRDIHRINYWLDTIRIYSNGKAKVFIILNESDDRKQNPEDYNEFKQGEYGFLVHEIYSFNINKDIPSLVNLYKDLSAYIRAVGHQTFGKNDGSAMRQIQKLFTKGTQIIKANDLERILTVNNIMSNKDQKRMKELLNTLGVALGYGFMKDYVLDPYWISHGVYKVIDYLQTSKSVFINYNELDVVFASERDKYPADKREHILNLMDHFQIGFRDKGGFRGLAVPCVASQTKPNDVSVDISPENLVTWIERDGLMEFPADFFYRYICGNQNDIKRIGKRWAMWQEGVILEGANANALLELTENRRIKITVWGEGKYDYNKQLSHIIHELFGDYRFTPYEEERKRGGKVMKFIELVVEAAAKGAAKAGIEIISGNAIK